MVKYGECTIPETNISPENGWLEDCFPFGKAYFLGGEHVSFGEGGKYTSPMDSMGWIYESSTSESLSSVNLATFRPAKPGKITTQ